MINAKVRSMRVLLCSVLMVISLEPNAQNKVNIYSQVDKIALQLPDSASRTSKEIAEYINRNFSSEADKSRAIFTWIANSIQYDVANMYAVNLYQTSEEIISKVLKTRKGICMHYAELFCSIANRVGIKSYVVSGYTKINGAVVNTPHAWCASLIDSEWYLTDPTWGAGYVQNSKFTKKINNLFYKAKPEQLAKSHMPFDPLWQLISSPITYQEFSEGKVSISKSRPLFNYRDTLAHYEQESEIEKMESSSRRIEQNGMKNSMIFDYLQHNKREIEYYNNKQQAEAYNSAVNFYNEGAYQLNSFIDYRNKQFTPKKSDAEIQEIVDNIEKSFNNSREKLKLIKNPDTNAANAMTMLGKSIEEAMAKMIEQKEFVAKYLKTGKLFRKALFYKFSVMGVPAN